MITMSALSRLDEHEEELRKIGERMVRVEGRVEALEGGVGGLQSEVSFIQERLGRAEADRERMKEDHNRLAKRVTLLEELRSGDVTANRYAQQTNAAATAAAAADAAEAKRQVQAQQQQLDEQGLRIEGAELTAGAAMSGVQRNSKANKETAQQLAQQQKEQQEQNLLMQQQHAATVLRQDVQAKQLQKLGDDLYEHERATEKAHDEHELQITLAHRQIGELQDGDKQNGAAMEMLSKKSEDIDERARAAQAENERIQHSQHDATMLLSDRLGSVEERQERQGRRQDAFEERMGVQEGALALLMQDYASSPSSSSDATDTPQSKNSPHDTDLDDSPSPYKAQRAPFFNITNA